MDHPRLGRLTSPERLRGALAAGCVLMTAGAATVIVRSPSADCARVHMLEADSDAFYAALTHDPAADHSRWTAKLVADADGIDDPGLARRANTVATLADQMATVVSPLTNTRTAEAAPPPYARIGVQFTENLYALTQACPGGPDRLRLG